MGEDGALADERPHRYEELCRQFQDAQDVRVILDYREGSGGYQGQLRIDVRVSESVASC